MLFYEVTVSALSVITCKEKKYNTFERFTTDVLRLSFGFEFPPNLCQHFCCKIMLQYIQAQY